MGRGTVWAIGSYVWERAPSWRAFFSQFDFFSHASVGRLHRIETEQIEKPAGIHTKCTIVNPVLEQSHTPIGVVGAFEGTKATHGVGLRSMGHHVCHEYEKKPPRIRTVPFLPISLPPQHS